MTVMSLESHLLQWTKRPDPLHCFCFNNILVSQLLSGDVFAIKRIEFKLFVILSAPETHRQCIHGDACIIDAMLLFSLLQEKELLTKSHLVKYSFILWTKCL